MTGEHALSTLRYRIALLFVLGPMLICVALPTLIATVTVCCPCIVIMGRHSRGSKLEVMAAMSLWPVSQPTNRRCSTCVPYCCE